MNAELAVRGVGDRGLLNLVLHAGVHSHPDSAAAINRLKVTSVLGGLIAVSEEAMTLT